MAAARSPPAHAGAGSPGLRASLSPSYQVSRLFHDPLRALDTTPLRLPFASFSRRLGPRVSLRARRQLPRLPRLSPAPVRAWRPRASPCDAPGATARATNAGFTHPPFASERRRAGRHAEGPSHDGESVEDRVCLWRHGARHGTCSGGPRAGRFGRSAREGLFRYTPTGLYLFITRIKMTSYTNYFSSRPCPCRRRPCRLCPKDCEALRNVRVARRDLQRGVKWGWRAARYGHDL